MHTEIKKTKDGSLTLYVPELDEHYHSIHGAVQESMHVFIRAGLGKAERNNINLYEVGFGTGLNALLTLISKKPGICINYYAVEKYPLHWNEVARLGYDRFLSLTKQDRDLFRKMHEVGWDERALIAATFSLHKIHGDLLSDSLTNNTDLIYFDAFAPEAQPELWSEGVFTKLFSRLNPGGLLVTYCAKGEVRRRMVRAGFLVERLAGPPGKREMLRAQKPQG